MNRSERFDRIDRRLGARHDRVRRGCEGTD